MREGEGNCHRFSSYASPFLPGSFGASTSREVLGASISKRRGGLAR